MLPSLRGGFCRFGSAIRFGLIYCAMILPEVITVNYRLMGAKLRKARKRMRMTQEQAAEQAEMSASFLGHIERGSRIPSVETIVRLCKLYHVSADAILDVRQPNDITTPVQRHALALFLCKNLAEGRAKTRLTTVNASVDGV